MDDIISRLSEIEDSSQSYIDDAILKKKEIAAEMNAKKELWKQDLDAKTKSRIAALQESMNVAKKRRYWNLSSNLKKPLGICKTCMTLTMINMWIHYFQK